MVRASVVVPAHNEVLVLARCLGALLADAERSELEVVVVCNGCTDDTASVARSFADAVTVIEVSEASKTLALNVGDRATSAYPRFYVDADVEMGISSLRQVADVLAEGIVDCAAPRPTFTTEDRSWTLRAFYQVWQELPYLNDEMIGSGVYALSEGGRRRWGEFPDITADDQFVMQLFSGTERRSVTGATFRVHPPRTLRGLVRMRARAYRGNAELDASGRTAGGPPGGAGRALVRLGRRPRWWPKIAVFATVNLAAKVRVRRYRGGWERDESARSGDPALSGPVAAGRWTPRGSSQTGRHR